MNDVYKMPIRSENSHKGSFGKVLNFSGSNNYIGAAYLSTYATLKIGAGLVALATDKKVIQSVATMLPESIFYSREDGIKNLKDYSVVLIGCGLGLSLRSKLLFDKVLKLAQNNNLPTVIDADGLNILSKKKIKLPQNTIITPHPLEASRLLNIKLQDVLNNMQDAAVELSTKYKCITVLKSHRTIICNFNKQIFINQHGNSALAKAGSGDVLAGIIAGLLAQKMEVFDAAKLGVYIHSRAGEIASDNLTQYSVLATDTIKNIPNVIRELIGN